MGVKAFEDSMAPLPHLPSHIPSHQDQRECLGLSTVFGRRREAAAPFAGWCTHPLSCHTALPSSFSPWPKFHGCEFPACAAHFSRVYLRAPVHTGPCQSSGT